MIMYAMWNVPQDALPCQTAKKCTWCGCSLLDNDYLSLMEEKYLGQLYDLETLFNKNFAVL